MPLYEYQCDACAHRFERIQKFSDPPIETCPTCGSAVRKLLSSPAIQFKGSGWYITDYAKKSGSSDTSSSTKSTTEKSTEKTSEKSSDSGTSSTKESTPTKAS